MKGSLLGLRGLVRPSGGQETVGVRGMENGFLSEVRTGNARLQE